jgi:hypothetical protein
MFAAPIEDLDLTMQTIPGIQAPASVAGPSLLAGHKPKMREGIQNTRAWTRDHNVR